MTNEIYNLKLHETYYTSEFQVIRVPGGWIYRIWDWKREDYFDHSVFVPFNNEFNIKPEATPAPSNGEICSENNN